MRGIIHIKPLVQSTAELRMNINLLMRGFEVKGVLVRAKKTRFITNASCFSAEGTYVRRPFDTIDVSKA